MKVIASLLDAISPDLEECIVCSRSEHLDHYLCSDCKEKVMPHQHNICPVCGRERRFSLCRNCIGKAHYYEKGACALIYEEFSRSLIHSFKYYGHLYYRKMLIAYMLDALRRQQIPIPDLIVPIPMHPLRLLNRGYNASYVLARALGEVAKCPVAGNVLRRTHYTRPLSAGADRKKRTRTVRAAYGPGKGVCAGLCVLLVDDVSTSGETINVCAKILMEKGARKVYTIVAAGAAV